MSPFHLQIISPERVEFDGEVASIVAPGEAGYLGVLTDHAPLLTSLQDGRLTVRGAPGDAEKNFAWFLSGGGFLEVHKNKVIILAQKVEKGGKTDSPSASGKTAS